MGTWTCEGDDEDPSFRPTIILSSLDETPRSVDHIDCQGHNHQHEEHMEQQPTSRLQRHNARPIISSNRHPEQFYPSANT
ncbi:hypothetical protein BIW11_11709 [Tropilaelaps mercedesae]|uniref:Uncharacterized protein n=1 Tax=Tropilaelaps mercedesae TaxID=418985 RepID=A0A1V9X9U6_9ACAR|nr:hypothetical protein BIW11_11709 [Tropilaelaps mercedesae]